MRNYVVNRITEWFVKIWITRTKSLMDLDVHQKADARATPTRAPSSKGGK